MAALQTSAVDAAGMTRERRLQLRDKVKEQFNHGYDNYLTHAFPHDELNPVTCTGRSRDNNPDNWNVNDVLGNFSLTLIDSLDAHAIMNDTKKFEDAVRLVIRHVNFDLDSRVQVFEVTIRVLGALLSAHTLAVHPTIGFQIPWYADELLALAQDLGDRLMPAFNTPTGIPWPRVNLRTGVLPYEAVSTCSAGAGTLILEFGLLSRLTGDPKYEAAAKRALMSLWERRSSLDLIGNTINVLDGKWINELAGIGAGIDSFYEYLFKAYVLFGETEYVNAWDVAYQGLIKHVRDERGLLYKTINMDTGALATTWMDSLAAFFPGLQVLAGDLKNAAALHQLYFAIWTRYSALPERFDFNTRAPAISSYPLRPELIESTYMLYQATRDPWYLEVGERFLNDFEKMARVRCGFASLADVEAGTHDDRMESFFLSETLKYLYLLFDDDNFVHTLHDNHVFTTEGHLLLLPYTLQNHQSASAANETNTQSENTKLNRTRVCARYTPLPAERRSKPPNTKSDNSPPVSAETMDMIERLVVGTGQEVRPGLQQVKVEPADGSQYTPARTVRTATGLFLDHLAGVTLGIADEGATYRVKTVNEVALSDTEMITVPARGIAFLGSTDGNSAVFEASPLIRLVVEGLDKSLPLALATYGPALASGERIDAWMVTPLASQNERAKSGIALGCAPHPVDMAANIIEGNLLLLSRGGCSFSEKTEWAELAGAIGIVVANNEGSGIFPMAPGENVTVDTASIPSAMVSAREGAMLVQRLRKSASGRLNVQLLGPDEVGDAGGEGGVVAAITGEALDTRVQFAGRQISNIRPTHQVFNRAVKQRQRDRAALRSDSRDVDYLKDEVADRLVDRLLDIKRRFGKVVDLGSGAGHIAKFVDSEMMDSLVMYDSSAKLLHRDAEQTYSVPVTRVHGDEESLPFAPDSVDAILSSLSLHWVNDIPGTLIQARRALKPDGVFVGAMFGGETLYELRTAMQLAEIEREGGVSAHVSPMTEVKDIAALLQRAGFNLITVDVDEIAVSYPSMFELIADLRAMGESNAVAARKPHMSRDVLLAAAAAYKGIYGAEDGSIPATFQVIYMIGWKPDPSQPKPLPRGSGEVSFKDLESGLGQTSSSPSQSQPPPPPLPPKASRGGKS